MFQLEYDGTWGSGSIGFYLNRSKEWEREHRDFRQQLLCMNRFQRRQSAYYALRSLWMKRHLDEIIDSLDESDSTKLKDYVNTLKVEQYEGKSHCVKFSFDNGVVVLDTRHTQQCAWASDLRDLVIELRYLFGLKCLNFRDRYLQMHERDERFVLPENVTVTRFTLLPKKYKSSVNPRWKQVQVDDYFYDYHV